MENKTVAEAKRRRRKKYERTTKQREKFGLYAYILLFMWIEEANEKVFSEKCFI